VKQAFVENLKWTENLGDLKANDKITFKWILNKKSYEGVWQKY